MTRWLAIVGVGEDGIAGLDADARGLIEKAELLVGGERHLAMVPAGSAARFTWERPLSRTVERIAAWRGRRVVVLATGDPMWYGVGVTLSRRFARDELVVLPQHGAFSLAAARLAWPLAECATLTLHGRPLDRLRRHLAPGERILVLSEDGATPEAVASLLAAEGWGASLVTVLEHLGGGQERIATETADSWSAARCADLNTVAIECRAGPEARVLSPAPGLPDDVFAHDGQLTKREVRAVTLSALAPRQGEMLWDVGLGAGSIAIEWLLRHPSLKAIGIEAGAERAARAARNAAALGTPDLRIVQGRAPAALQDLPKPDAAFIGGGLGEAGLFEAVWSALKPGGRMVANAVSLASEARLIDYFQCLGGELVRLEVARAGKAGTGKDAGGVFVWRPAAPIIQWRARKP